MPRSALLVLLVGWAACAPRVAAPPLASGPLPPQVEEAGETGVLDGGAMEETAEEAEEEQGEEEAPVDPERSGLSDAGYLYTLDLSDAALAEKWKSAPASLGSISIGFADEGRLLNGRQVPPGAGYTVVSPEKAWGTAETVDYVLAAIRRVTSLHPDAPPLRVNQISAREGGYLRPHHSHQSGRDVDLAFYYPTAQVIRTRQREKVIDVPLNWELIKAIASETDVEFILVDRRVQKVLYEYAKKKGESPAFLDSVFHSGRASLLQHARGHRDHFHVRFFNGRAQELGRRVAPLLGQRPEQNRLMHHVRNGDTLGALARRYGSSVAAIEKANHLKRSFLRLGQVLQIPLRGPCTQCPVPAAVVVPPRRLPPALDVADGGGLRVAAAQEPGAATTDAGADDPPDTDAGLAGPVWGWHGP